MLNATCKCNLATMQWLYTKIYTTKVDYLAAHSQVIKVKLKLIFIFGKESVYTWLVFVLSCLLILVNIVINREYKQVAFIFMSW